MKDLKKYTKHFLILLLFGIALNISSSLSMTRAKDFPVNIDRPIGMQFFSQMLGEVRTILSSYLIIKADFYHHEREDLIDWRKDSATLPLYRLITTLDPNNTRGYDFGSYQLAVNMKRYHEGIKFLREGLHYNPGNYTLLFTMGDIYYLKSGVSKLKESDITDWNLFMAAMKVHIPSYTNRIWERIGKENQEIIAQWSPLNPLTDEQKASIIAGLNRIQEDPDFYQKKDFQQLDLDKEARLILAENRHKVSSRNLKRLNRLLLESSLPHMLREETRRDFENADRYFRQAYNVVVKDINERSAEGRPMSTENLIRLKNCLRRLYWTNRKMKRFGEAQHFLKIWEKVDPKDKVTIRLERELDQLASGVKSEDDFGTEQEEQDDSHKGHSHEHEGHDHDSHGHEGHNH